MKKYLYKFVVFVLTVTLSFPLFSACNGGSDSGTKLTVWAASSTEKIFREQSDVDVSQKAMRIQMARNEYEGAQLMMRAETGENIEYDVLVSDLVCGNYILSSDNVFLYNVKYISSVGIGQQYNNSSLPVGSSMPDALLPFETAIEYGENTISAGENQSVYIEIFAPKETAAGTYTGIVTLVADGYAYDMPLYVTVEDYKIPDSPNTKNYFARWGREHYVSAELNCTDEYDEIAFETMLRYRMSSSLPFEGEGGTERYVQLLRKYYNAPGFSAYKFFYEATYSVYNDMLIAYNVPLCKEYLMAVIEASIEDKVDYLEKAFFYFSTFIDEPDTNPVVTWDMVASISQTFEQMLKDVAADADIAFVSHANYSFYKNQVRNSLLNIPNVLPGGYQISALETYDAEGITACTELSHFDTASARDSFQREDMETWWYTCIGPQYPYPNLLANSWLVGTRLISWMQRAYDIDGFLIWDALNFTNDDDNGIPVVDTYSYLTDTMSGVSDGKIFYPGAPYGITGPIASLRAVAYRDGMEDYELLQGIYDAYSDQGLDASVALESIYSQVFSGAVTTEDSALFAQIRTEVFELLASTRGDTAIFWAEISVHNDDAEVAFKIPHTASSVTIDGQTIVAGADGLYRVSLKSFENNSVTVSVTAGGNTTKYTKYIFGQYTAVSGFENETNDIVSVNGSSSAEISSEYTSAGNKSVKVTLNGRNDEDSTTYMPWFSLSVENIDDFSTTQSIIFDVYSESERTFTVVARYGSTVTYEQTVTQLTLQEGWNHIELELPTSVKSLENVQELRFRTSNILSADGAAESLNLYIDEIGYRSEGVRNVLAADKGEIIVHRTDQVAGSGNKVWLIVENDVSNVTDEEYLILADFENYNQAAQIRYANNFGKIELVSDSQYVTNGESAAKLTIVGRGESQRHYDPIMIIYTGQDYFQKTDFSDVDYIEFDMYNAMNYDITVRFTDTTTYYSQYTVIQSITLEPGMNHICVSLDQFKQSKGSSIFDMFCFVFDRGELFEEDRIVYVDNIRAHYAQ